MLFCNLFFYIASVHASLSRSLQLIVAISDPPRKQDAPKPLNFKSSALPGFAHPRAPQPRRFAIAISPTNPIHSKQNVDFVSDQTKLKQTWLLSSILRSVLCILKEDAATISNLRTIANTQFEEYVLHVDDLTRQLDTAAKENKTLNQLLRLAVRQKISVTERLQNMKM